MHTAGPLKHQSCSFKVEIAIENLKHYKPLSMDQFPAELFQTGNEEIINSIWNKEELPQQWK
jgi:hypothetical protein